MQNIVWIFSQQQPETAPQPQPQPQPQLANGIRLTQQIATATNPLGASTLSDGQVTVNFELTFSLFCYWFTKMKCKCSRASARFRVHFWYSRLKTNVVTLSISQKYPFRANSLASWSLSLFFRFPDLNRSNMLQAQTFMWQPKLWA